MWVDRFFRGAKHYWCQICRHTLQPDKSRDTRVPERVTTDRARQFESEIFRKLSQLLGTKNIHTTAYHPQANGVVERLYCSLKASLHVELTNTKWLAHLPLIFLGLHTTVKKELNCLAAEALYGTTLRLPAQYFLDFPQKVMDMTSFVDRLFSKMSEMDYFPAGKNRRDREYVSKVLKSNIHVPIRDTGYINIIICKELSIGYLFLHRWPQIANKSKNIKTCGKKSFTRITFLFSISYSLRNFHSIQEHQLQLESSSLLYFTVFSVLLQDTGICLSLSFIILQCYWNLTAPRVVGQNKGTVRVFVEVMWTPR